MLRAIFRNAGFQPRRLVRAVRGWRRFQRDRRAFRSASGAEAWTWGRELPILTEWDESAGNLGAYFYQDLTVARWIREGNPERHVDVGSRIDGFIGHLAVFREVEVIDIRPMSVLIPGVRFHQLDLIAELPAEWIGCTDSLSCLHTVEHFGLGRYGDAIDPLGHERGICQLKAMVKPGGRLYLSTPMGRERIEFNAHRIFAPKRLLGWFAEGFELERAAVIDDAGKVSEATGAGCADLIADAACETGVGIVAARKGSGDR